MSTIISVELLLWNYEYVNSQYVYDNPISIAINSTSENTEEASRVVQLVRLLVKKCSIEKSKLVVLTGYRKQVQIK